MRLVQFYENGEIRNASLGAESPHQRPAKRTRSEPLVELPTSPPLPLQLQEQEHQPAATFDPDTLDCQICMEALSAPIFQVSSIIHN